MKNNRNPASVLLALFMIALLAGCDATNPTLAPTASLIVPSATVLPAPLPSQTSPPTQPPQPTSTTPSIPFTSFADWQKTLLGIKWVAYSPTTANPDKGIEPTIASIQADLDVLKEAGFTGLVTYASSGVTGRKLPTLAQEAGFDGLIIGIWDPKNAEERKNAVDSASLSLVRGFCVCNEGLGKRYQFDELSQAITELKQVTSKPVTTTEEIDDYSDAKLLALGDWVFPNSHPYFHSVTDPQLAVRWTQAAYTDLSRRAGRLVIFKEVGLPTAGKPGENLSQENQDRYYQGLEQSQVKFVYFEGFDQPWKLTLPVEPNWGLFTADRLPKVAARRMMNSTPNPPPTSTLETSAFYVYKDIDFPGNHFSPTGYMGDIGDIKMDEAYPNNPYAGKTSIKVTYTAKEDGPHECQGAPHCAWAGVYWLEPPNNWGTNDFWKDSGYDLTGFKSLTFWARADRDTIIDFKVGGIVNPYGDSLEFPRSIVAELTTSWKKYEIDLSGADLTHIIGGFVWVTNLIENNEAVTFYLDEIRYEK